MALLTAFIATLSTGCSSRASRPSNRMEYRTVIKELSNTIALLDTTEGYLLRIRKCLRRSRELAVQAANGIYTGQDRRIKNLEFYSLLDEISRLVEHALFNGMPVLNTNDKRWPATVQVIPDARQPSLVIKLPALDPSVWKMFSTDRAHYDRNGTPTGNPVVSHISSIGAATVAIGRIDFALMDIAEKLAINGDWKTRLDYASRIQQALLEKKPEIIKLIVRSIEKRVFHLSLRSANGIYSPFDRRLLNHEYVSLVLELKRIGKVYGVKSGLAVFNPRTENLLTVRSADSIRMRVLKTLGKQTG